MTFCLSNFICITSYPALYAPRMAISTDVRSKPVISIFNVRLWDVLSLELIIRLSPSSIRSNSSPFFNSWISTHFFGKLIVRVFIPTRFTFLFIMSDDSTDINSLLLVIIFKKSIYFVFKP